MLCRVKSGDTAPTATRSGISISAAKNEFEPFQLVIQSPSPSVTVSMSSFSIGAGCFNHHGHITQYSRVS